MGSEMCIRDRVHCAGVAVFNSDSVDDGASSPAERYFAERLESKGRNWSEREGEREME